MNHDGAFRLHSDAFENENPIPQKYTCDGQNMSPPLRWGPIPAETRSFVLIVDDPDAPDGTFTHWVLFDIPASIEELSEGASGIGVSGENDFQKMGYGGPCPQAGNLVHRYFFALTAVNVESFGLRDGASREAVESAMSGHVVGRAQIVGTYWREAS